MLGNGPPKERSAAVGISDHHGCFLSTALDEDSVGAAAAAVGAELTGLTGVQSAAALHAALIAGSFCKPFCPLLQSACSALKIGSALPCSA